MRRAKTIMVWEVLADGPGSGPAGDGTHVRRFRSEREAHTFAAQSTCYGRPTEARLAEVPRRIAERWGMA